MSIEKFKIFQVCIVFNSERSVEAFSPTMLFFLCINFLNRNNALIFLYSLTLFGYKHYPNGNLCGSNLFGKTKNNALSHYLWMLKQLFCRRFSVAMQKYLRFFFYIQTYLDINLYF